MKYFFDPFELPSSTRKWIIQQRKAIDELIEEKKKKDLQKLESQLFASWGWWKQRVDIVSRQSQPNSREQLIEARMELTRYNEVLLYIGNKSPYTSIRMKETVRN